MSTIVEKFTAKLRAVSQLFRRPTVDTPDLGRVDGAQPPLALDWFSSPSGVARTWEEALGPASDAPRQQAEQPID